MQKRVIRPEDGIIAYVIALAIYQIIGVILSTVVKDKGDAYIFIAYAIPQVLYIVTIAVYFTVRKVDFSPLPARENVRPLHYLFAAIVGLGLFFFALLPNHGIVELFKLLGRTLKVTVPTLDSPVNIVFAVLIICLLPAIGEELMFRKVFCDAFSAYGKVPCILITGVMFGLTHYNLAQTFYQIFLGVVLSYVYVKTKNVTLTSVIHFGNNFLALFMTKFTGEEPWTNLVVLGVSFAVGAVLLVGGLMYFFMKTPRLPLKGKWVGRYEKEETTETEILAVFTDGKRFEPVKTEVREKPSFYAILFFAVVAVVWLIAAIVG